MSHSLLQAPIGRSLLRLAGPTTAIMTVQILVAIAETIIIGRLGTEALAGFALVFPFMVLMLNMAHGGIGGGVAAAMARAIGGGQTADARALVQHALLLAIGIGLLFTILAWTVAPQLYALMGGTGGVLRQARLFSDIWFGAAVFQWLNATSAALLRGSGDTVTPARFGFVTSGLYVPLAAFLALGGGGWPGLGIAGPAIASALVTVLSMGLLLRTLRRGRAGSAAPIFGQPLQGRLFRQILRVGLVSSLTSVIGNLTAMVMTGLVGRYGAAALAGYGVAIRLEYMLGPIAFGIGTGLTTLVGVAAGAGAWPRAVRAAWTGGLIAFACIGALGWAAALVPETWTRLFASDPAVIAVSVSCITTLAPFYGLFGLGLTLNFASQGAGRMLTPFGASVTRMLVTLGAGWLLADTLGLRGVFIAIALGMVTYGSVIGGVLLLAPWRARPKAGPRTAD